MVSDALTEMFSGHLTAMLRSLVIGRLGRAGDQSVIEEARKRFAAHCDGSAPIPADLRNAVRTFVVFCTLVTFRPGFSITDLINVKYLICKSQLYLKSEI